VTSRTAARSGSSASAACESKVSVRHRRRALLARRIDEAAGHDAGHEAVPPRVLLDVADAPCRALRMQVHRELGVVLAREGVELARPRHHVEHVGKVGRGADRLGDRLDALHELGVFDLVERAGPAGELHARLELGVALAGDGRLPAASLAVEAFDEEQLAADEAPRREVRRDRLGRDRRVEAEGGEGIDKRVELQGHALGEPTRRRRARIRGRLASDRRTRARRRAAARARSAPRATRSPASARPVAPATRRGR
jgi:hypothetical protein